MAKVQGKHRKKNIYVKTTMAITVLMGILTGLLSISLLAVNIKLSKDQKAISQMEQSASEAETELKTVKAQEEECQQKQEVLTQQLAQYKPVVIPDSMK